MTKKILLLFTLTLTALSITSCGVLKKGQNRQANKSHTTESNQTIINNEDKSLSAYGIDPTSLKLSGEWTVTAVYNNIIDLEEMPYINFEIPSKTFYGNFGCNTINGNFAVSTGQKLGFDNVITTLRYCDNMKTEKMIIEAINSTASYFFTEENGIENVKLCDQKGIATITLKRHNLNILNGAWTVSKIGDKKIKREDVKFVIDIQENKIHGNSGCNIFNGEITLDPKKDNAIQFSNIISTRKACPDMSTETALLVGLESIEHYKKINNREIEFYDNSNNRILIIKRLDLK